MKIFNILLLALLAYIIYRLLTDKSQTNAQLKQLQASVDQKVDQLQSSVDADMSYTPVDYLASYNSAKT